MTTTSDRAFAPTAGGYLPGGLDDTDIGLIAPDVNGCHAVWTGLAAGWEIQLENPELVQDYVVNYNGAPGSGVNGGLSLYSSLGGNVGQFTIVARQIAAAGVITAVSVPIHFTAYHRPQAS